ncbi:unnamed protein product, partial [Orchesella dallaii]
RIGCTRSAPTLASHWKSKMAYRVTAQSFLCIGYASAGETLPSPYRTGGCEAITVQRHRATTVPLPRESVLPITLHNRRHQK